jgi:uncharacterized protein (DUF697 family)
MIKAVKQVRAAIGLLNPSEVVSLATRPVRIGLVADGSSAYAEMEEFLIPTDLPRPKRLQLLEQVFRASDPGVPEKVDLVLYEPGIPCPDGAYTFHRDDPSGTIAEILRDHDDISLPLARQFLAFRKPVVEGMIHSVARENALFAMATALPNVIPSLIEVPWVLGEFASDTAFLTINQVRMAFEIAAAYGSEVGLSQQKMQVISIGAGAFGWRALARELVSHIPLGGGLIPKGAIAYAGTFVVGKGLEYYHETQQHHTPQQRKQIYQQAYERGKSIA